MHKVLVLLLTLYAAPAFSQVWTVGDSTGYQVAQVSTTFLPNSKVSFDIDCDGQEDVNINSSGPIDINSPWSRLSFSMQDSVTCIMLDPGFITPFAAGQDIDLADESIYEHRLDYICGNGAAGGYGQCDIQERYLVFRKKAEGKTSHLFILFSNFNIDFTIHYIISSCSRNPIEILSSTTEAEKATQITVSPNPSSHYLRFSHRVDHLKVYSIDGRQVFNSLGSTSEVDISALETGIYVLRFEQEGKSHTKQFIKL